MIELERGRTYRKEKHEPELMPLRKRAQTVGEMKRKEALRDKVKDIHAIRSAESGKSTKRKLDEETLRRDKELEDEIKMIESGWTEPAKTPKSMEDFPPGLKLEPKNVINITPDLDQKYKLGMRKNKQEILRTPVQDYPLGYFQGYEHLIEENTLYVFMTMKDLKDHITKDLPEPQFLGMIRDI